MTWGGTKVFDADTLTLTAKTSVPRPNLPPTGEFPIYAWRKIEN